MSTIMESARQTHPEYTPVGENPSTILNRASKYGHVDIVRYVDDPSEENPLVIIEPGTGAKRHPHRVDLFDLHLEKYDKDQGVLNTNNVTVNKDGSFRLTYKQGVDTVSKDVGSQHTAGMVITFVNGEWIAKAINHLPKTAKDIDDLTILHNGKNFRPIALITKFQHGKNPHVLLPHYISYHAKKPLPGEDYGTTEKVWFRWVNKSIEEKNYTGRLVTPRTPNKVALESGIKKRSNRSKKRHHSGKNEREKSIRQTFRQLPKPSGQIADTEMRNGHRETPAFPADPVVIAKSDTQTILVDRVSEHPISSSADPSSEATSAPKIEPIHDHEGGSLDESRKIIAQVIQQHADSAARGIVTALERKYTPSPVAEGPIHVASHDMSRGVTPSPTEYFRDEEHVEPAKSDPSKKQNVENLQTEEPEEDPISRSVKKSAKELFDALEASEKKLKGLKFAVEKVADGPQDYKLNVLLTDAQALQLFGVNRGKNGLTASPRGGGFKTIDARLRYKVDDQIFDNKPWALDPVKKSKTISKGSIRAETAKQIAEVTFELNRSNEGKRNTYTLTLKGDTSDSLIRFLNIATTIHTPVTYSHRLSV